MMSTERVTARRLLDKRLKLIPNFRALERPPRGWIRAIRDALGMSAGQVGARMGVSQPRVSAVEKSEVDGSLTLASLENAARALNCRLVYALVPETSLDTIVRRRAEHVARRQLARTAHSMALEDQRADPADEDAQLQSLVARLVETAGPKLWEHED